MNSKQTEMKKNDEIKEQHSHDVTAKALKSVLWETIGKLRAKTVKVEEAEAISKASVGILATVKLELEVAKLMGVTGEALADFVFSKRDMEFPKLAPPRDKVEKELLKGQPVYSH